MSAITRYAGLGYRKDAPNLWRFVDRETNASIGAQYRTRVELLADVERFASERGFIAGTRRDPLVVAVNAWLEADKLTPADCYDANGNPNENWGAVDRAKARVRAALGALGEVSP